MAKARPRKRKAQVVLDDSELDDEPARPSQKLSLNLLKSSKSPQGKKALQQPLTKFTQVRSPAADPISANTPEPRATFCHTHPDTDAQTWTAKHAPKLQQDLVVHSKKVAEVEAWLAAAADLHGPPCAIISGPCGCGKASTIRAVACSLQLDVVDWRPSAPTLWAESSYQSGSGVPYVSKLEALQEFASRAKMAGLQFHISASDSPQPRSSAQQRTAQAERGAATNGRQPLPGVPTKQSHAARPARRLILMDDLPQAHDASQRAALLGTMCETARTARGPLAFLLSDATGSTSSSHSGGTQAGFAFHKELVDALKAAGAQQISFNPFTEAVLTRRLLAIADTEGMPLAKAQAESLAMRAAGNMSAAINSLQLSTRSRPKAAISHANVSKTGKKGKANSKRAKTAAQAPAPGFDGWLDSSGSDPTLTMMHALGKFLYNKRLPPGTQAPSVSQAMENNMLRGGVLGNLDTMRLSQPSASQHSAGQVVDEPDSGNQRQHQAAGSQPSQLSCESSKLGGQAGGEGIPLSSWPDDDGVFTEADDLIDLTVEDALSQQQQQQPSGLGTSHPDPVDVADLPMAARHVRDPIAFQPEPVLMQSGLEASAVSSFLHENMLHFIDDPGIEDAANALEYLSTADWLLQQNSTLGSSSTPWEEPSFAASSLKEALAGSVAVRGWLYSSVHPGPRRFQAMRGPQALLVQKAAAANRAEANAVYCRLAERRCQAPGALTGPASISCSSLFGSWRIFAGEVLPYVRAIGENQAKHPACNLLPHSWSRIWAGRISSQSVNIPESHDLSLPKADIELLEDDIEDWEI